MRVTAFLRTTLRLTAALYLASAAFGLVPTLLALAGLAALAGDRPWRADLLAPGWMNLAVEIVMSAAYTRDAAGLALLVVAALVGLPLALLGQLAAYSFLAGGVLETLRAAPAPPPPFPAACRRWFWPFLRLSLVGGMLSVAAFVGGLLLAWFAVPLIGADAAALAQLALQAVVVGWVELARALLVEEGSRSAGAALARSARCALRPVVVLAWLVLALPGLGLTLAALLPPEVADPFAPLGFVQALLFGQLVAFAAAWTKIVRLAVAIQLARVAMTTPPAPLRDARSASSVRG